jgi:hypothetical protein
MQIVVNIPDEVVLQVKPRGLGLEAYVQGLVVSDTAVPRPRLVRLGPGPFSPQADVRGNNRNDGNRRRRLPGC